MSFNKRAHIEIKNQNDEADFQYFHINYELVPLSHDEYTLFFHTHWCHENSINDWAASDIQVNSFETQASNLNREDNYVILELKMLINISNAITL